MVDHPAGTLPSIHPTILVRAGRGGAGNYRLVEPSPSSPSSASSDRSSSTFSKISFKSSSSGIFASGRGGAGNMHFASERAMFHFDEELAHERRRPQTPAPIYHIGRGGAANFVAPSQRRDERNPRSSLDSDDSDRDGNSAGSENSTASGRWVLWHKIRGAFTPS
ncbi:hypothetical protein FGG08_006815 [Glutinoglossum americanum]|uniref:Uncharacterized protein n=1 Tax=Glutinoglossum americanum TaxID=1670608 RepID=A0A9P8KX30_9PEZI|nr:hypothetical protein FGG08_006815 [Glutinoglossum americanum]